MSAPGPVRAGALREPVPWSTEPLELGEGARWAGGALLLVDLLAGRLLRGSGDTPGPLQPVLGVPGPLGAVAPVRGSEDLWIAAAGDGLAFLRPPGTLEWIARPESWNDVPARMNDGTVDPGGRFWAGSMAWDGRGRAGSLYRVGPDCRVELVLDGIGITNGPVFDPGGEVMFVADTAAGEIYRWEIDPGSGALLDPDRSDPFVALEGPAGPDGMTVDRDGGLWVAVWGSSSVRRYRPDGRLDRVIDLPAAQPTSVCLGGPEGRRLFVTTATYGLEPPSPADGLVYAVDVEVPGSPAAAFTRAPGGGCVTP